MKPKACYEVYVVDETTAKEALKEVVKYLGLGFHPDNLAEFYVLIDSDKPVFEPFECKNLDENLDKCCNFIDIYDETIHLWGEFGMIDDKTQQHLEGLDHSCSFKKEL